jgi:hypothetical protein
MKKPPPPEQAAARLEPQRLAAEDGAKAMEEALDTAIAVRVNMARLEARGVRTEISTGNQPAKAKSKKRFR